MASTLEMVDMRMRVLFEAAATGERKHPPTDTSVIHIDGWKMVTGA